MQENNPFGAEAISIRVFTSGGEEAFSQEYAPDQWRDALLDFLRLVAKDKARIESHLIHVALSGPGEDVVLDICHNFYHGFLITASAVPVLKRPEPRSRAGCNYSTTIQIPRGCGVADWTAWALFRLTVPDTDYILEFEGGYLLQQGVGETLAFMQVQR